MMSLPLQKDSTSKNMKTRKPRCSNFGDEDKLKLITILSKFANVIENKSSEGPMDMEKVAAWHEVGEEYNRHCSMRSVDNLKNCWKNLKRQTRSYLATERAKDRQTGGGGENDFEKNPIFEEVIN